MPIMATKGSNMIFHLAPAGTHQAVCYQVYDLGIQKRNWKGKDIFSHRVKIAWEINEQVQSDDDMNGKRYRLYKDYTLSLDTKANLYKDLISWRGKEFTEAELDGFDIEKLKGVNCMLSVIHNKSGDKTYANVSTISKLMKGIEPIKPENSMTEIPSWVQKIQAKAVTSVPVNDGSDHATEQAQVDNTDDSEIPF